jgi:hypothetical protein
VTNNDANLYFQLEWLIEKLKSAASIVEPAQPAITQASTSEKKQAPEWPLVFAFPVNKISPSLEVALKNTHCPLSEILKSHIAQLLFDKIIYDLKR